MANMRRAAGGTVRAAAIAGLGLAVASACWAQPAPQAIPDTVVERMLRLGLENIHRAACDGFNACAPTTPEELEYPPITLDQARTALMAGTRTALAHWCGLDADRRSILPMTRHLRKVLRFNNRQVALMAVIHGIQQSAIAEQLKGQGACDQLTRARLDAQLPKS
jgi:hypothetical protein